MPGYLFPIEEILLSEAKAIAWEIEQLRKRHEWNLDSNPKRKDFLRVMETLVGRSNLLTRIINNSF